MLKRDPWVRWKMYLTHPLISMKWYLSLLQSNYGKLKICTADNFFFIVFVVCEGSQQNY